MKARNTLWLILMIGTIALGLWLDYRQASSGAKDSRGPGTTDRQHGLREQNPSGFTILRGAKILEHRNNDGDSFHIAHDGKEHEFRLYFVDCPESRLHQYNGDRIRQQGRYFGGLSTDRTIAIGRDAKAFTRQLLESEPFTIYTRWQPVYDSGRYYAFVFLPDGDGGGEELSEKLVRAGLCRIHTEGAALPDGRPKKDFAQHLRALEKEAKARKRGAWKP